MQLLYPIGLLALAGLIIPVVIHLWNTKQGKTLKIGSIVLLSENATSNSKSFKLTDLLLFFLRCLILILIAFLLAQPYLKKTILTTKNNGWILIDKTSFKSVYKTQHNLIDSLLNIGFELHDFNLGFKPFSLKDSTSKAETTSRLSYNSLLNQLNKQMPQGYSAYLFADRRLNNFEGNAPKLDFNLVWKEVKNQDSLKTWSTKFLAKAYEGKSTPSVTSYSANQMQILPTLTVAIYDPKGEDSKYIKAALRAISDFTKRRIEIEKSIAKADVVFWLSDEPIASSDEQRILSYQKGKIIAVNASLRLSADANEAIELKKRIAADNLKGAAVWTDSYGEPILLKEQSSNHFHFYSRFNPQWTDLVWNEQFVKVLIPIVLGNESAADFGFEANDGDQRVLDKAQLTKAKINSVGVSNITTNAALDKIIWILAFILLLIERILSFRKKPNLGYAKR